ncbi:hypothetical protein CPC08DRAFT_726781 [Agrocybe pediades]|nr:hypothetical protein CPC08DRAFT_726781 [Agrocybe pediades]
MSSNNYPELITPSELPQSPADSDEALVPFQNVVTFSPSLSASPHNDIATTGGSNSNSFNVSKQTLRNAYNKNSNHYYYYNYNYFGAEPSMTAPGRVSRTIEEEDDEDNNQDDISSTDLRVGNDVAEVYIERPSLRLQHSDSPSPATRTGGTSGEASNFTPESVRAVIRTSKRSHHSTQPSGWQNSAATTMSGKDGTCELVAVERKVGVFQNIRIPHPSIPEQAKAFMRSNFFDEDFIIPLWKTSPGLISKSDRPKQRNRVTMIGHVGNFNRQGGFEILFNIFKTEQENRENGFHPPANFVPYVPLDTVYPLSTSIFCEKDSHRMRCGDFKYVNRGPMHSDNTKHHIYSFQTIESNKPLKGAALPLPDGYTEHRFLLSAIAAMQKYFNEQAPSWYRYYATDITRSSGMLEGCLKLVTISLTAKTCGAATFIKNEKSRTAEIIYANMCRPNPNEDIYQWHRHDLVSTKAGPSTDEMVNKVAEFESQCVAIAVRKIKVKKTILSDITAGLSRSLSSLVSKKSQ